jgi:hypothetical protein
MKANKCVDSMIPIAHANGLSAQDAVNEAVAQLKASKKRFEVAAGALRTSGQEELVKYDHVSEWIDACQTLCTGNIRWR